MTIGNNLTVTVTGRPGSGKTAMAQIIADFLYERGFADVTLSYGWDGDPLRSEEQTQHVIDCIKGDRSVLVQCAQTNRAAITEDQKFAVQEPHTLHNVMIRRRMPIG